MPGVPLRQAIGKFAHLTPLLTSKTGRLPQRFRCRIVAKGSGLDAALRLDASVGGEHRSPSLRNPACGGTAGTARLLTTAVVGSRRSEIRKPAGCTSGS